MREIMLEGTTSAIETWLAVDGLAEMGDETWKMLLNADPGLLENACQAPAAVKIGVTLLFSEFSLQPAPTTCHS